MTPVPPKPDGNPYAVTPNGTPILVRDDRLEWIDDWTEALAVTLDDNFRPHDDTGALITPGSIGAAPALHTHTFAEITDGESGSYSPTWRSGYNGPALFVGTGSLEGRFLRLGSRLSATVILQRGSDTNLGSGTYSFSLPYQAAALAWVGGSAVYSGSGSLADTRAGAIVGLGGSQFGIVAHTGSTLTPNTVTWGTGGWIRATVEAEIV